MPIRQAPRRCVIPFFCSPKKKGGISPALPKVTIPWRFSYSTTERSISDHDNETGHHGHEARGADEQSCDHHMFTSFGCCAPG
jgi:hypothetical protein